MDGLGEKERFHEIAQMLNQVKKAREGVEGGRQNQQNAPYASHARYRARKRGKENYKKRLRNGGLRWVEKGMRKGCRGKKTKGREGSRGVAAKSTVTRNGQ